MSKQACKCKEVECEECPEWIFTLADLIMCMMGLFVILWVLKPGMQPKTTADAAAQTEDWLEVVGEIRGGFGWEPDPHSSDPVAQAMLRKRARQQGPGEGGHTEQRRTSPEGSEVENTSIRPGRQSAVGGRLLFHADDAQLTPATIKALDQIVLLIRGHRNIIMVKGHASLDDLGAEANAQQRMDLSLRRAQAVSDYLTSHGVDPEIVRVQGCSTFEPVVQRTYTPDAQSLNRRVEVEATTMLAEELQNPATATAPAAPSDPPPTYP